MTRPATVETDIKREYLGGPVTSPADAAAVAVNPPVGNSYALGAGELNVRAAPYNAKGDGQIITDGVITSGQAILTSASGKFTSADVGKLIFVLYAGAAQVTLVTTILSYQSATQVTLAANAGASLASGGMALWASDDTAAFTAWLNDLQVAPGCRGFMPRGHYGVNGALPAIANPIDVLGSGVFEGLGSVVANSNSVNQPVVFPYLTGTVVWQFAAATDALQVTGAGITANLNGFGLGFGSMYNNTGHGINVLPPADGGNKDTGIGHCRWDNIAVYGHDGNHYGYRIVNPFLNSLLHLRSYGGGGLFIRGDTTRTVFGNEYLAHFYSVVFLNGTSHGIRVEASANGRLAHFDWDRVQSWVFNPTVAIPGTTGPSTSQKMFSTDNNVQAMDILSPDWESNQGSTADTGWGQGLRVFGGYGSNLDTIACAVGISNTLVSESALVVEGQSSSQSADLVRVFDFHGGSTVFGIKGNVFGSGTFSIRSFVNETFAASYTPDVTNSNSKRMTLTAAVTVNNPTGAKDGMHIRFHWKQNGTGGWTVTYGTNFRTTGAAAIVTTANTYTVDEFEYVSADTAWRLVSRITGITA